MKDVITSVVEAEIVKICIAAGYVPEQRPNRHGKHFRLMSDPPGVLIVYLFDFTPRDGSCGTCLNCQTMLGRISYYPTSVNGPCLFYDPCVGRKHLIPLDDPRSFEKIENLVTKADHAGLCVDYE